MNGTTIPVAGVTKPSGDLAEAGHRGEEPVARTASHAAAIRQSRGPAYCGGHLGGVGRRSHADGRCRRAEHQHATILPLGATGIGGLRIGLRAAAAGGVCQSSTRRWRSFGKEVVRLRQDCARQQALVRASQRTIGLAPPPQLAQKSGKKATGKAGVQRHRKAETQAAAYGAGIEGSGGAAGQSRHGGATGSFVFSDPGRSGTTD